MTEDEERAVAMEALKRARYEPLPVTEAKVAEAEKLIEQGREARRTDVLKDRIKEHILHAYGETTMLPGSREKSLVLTKLDEARHWLADVPPVAQVRS